MKIAGVSSIKVSTEIIVNYIYDNEEVKTFLTNLIAADFDKLKMSVYYTLDMPLRETFGIGGQILTSFNGSFLEIRNILVCNGNVAQDISSPINYEELEKGSKDLVKCMVTDEIAAIYMNRYFHGFFKGLEVQDQ